ncbi:MAG: prenyltransferase/squalene oxidase repeat-containing protein [Luteolibacter sp.]|uniref:prenyltransferase/squalene oxidase repeat-containing protein n=1 Tax=Luteolibacter sp. TaxID=1962973 RepID=UPI0032635A63
MKLLSTLIILGTAIASADPSPSYESLKQEMRQAIARGNAWLKTQQKPGGNWDDEGVPAFTALALTAATRDPNFDRKAAFPEHVEKGYTWLLAQQKEDGGIYNRGLSVYNTANSVTALVSAGREGYEGAIVKARKHLIDNQWDIDKKKETDNVNDGGVGYGSHNDHTDMSNTWMAIEALALSKKVIEDGKHGDQPDLDWDAAVTFLSRQQNLEETNDQGWASNDPKNKGGFIYGPNESKAGEDKLPNGRTALRSYGSMSYAGLLSFIYAKVSATDPRVVAVKEWLGKNYTTAENPGMGDQGLYYYYQTMSKALSVANISRLKLENGQEVDWRKELGEKLLATQRGDGSWINENGRWMESNPVLVTAYTVLSLEQVYDSIPEK